MKTNNQITQKDLQTILVNLYNKGYQSNDLNVQAAVKEIKKDLLAIYKQQVSH